MRIISGKAGRRKIRVPGSVARPSTDRLREALFSILGGRVVGARVLDMFAGSGALGLECLSRGAASCVFVDDSRQAQQVIKKNLSDLGLEGGRVLSGDALRFLQSDRGEDDLGFADPPYCKAAGDTDYVSRLLETGHLASRLAGDGLLVIEDAQENSRADTESLQLIDQRHYGGCGILFYQRRANR